MPVIFEFLCKWSAKGVDWWERMGGKGAKRRQGTHEEMQRGRHRWNESGDAAGKDEIKVETDVKGRSI